VAISTWTVGEVKHSTGEATVRVRRGRLISITVTYYARLTFQASRGGEDKQFVIYYIKTPSHERMKFTKYGKVSLTKPYDELANDLSVINHMRDVQMIASMAMKIRPSSTANNFTLEAKILDVPII